MMVSKMTKTGVTSEKCRKSSEVRCAGRTVVSNKSAVKCAMASKSCAFLTAVLITFASNPAVINGQSSNDFTRVALTHDLTRVTNTRGNIVPCYDDYGNATHCFPPFSNAGYRSRVQATNTCGRRGPQRYCYQVWWTDTRSCEICDENVPGLSHAPEFLTDFNSGENLTWWQSETMFEGVDADKRHGMPLLNSDQVIPQVNLTIDLGKSFRLVYIMLKFKSSRPDSFAIYKKVTKDGDWIPFQYFSSSCRDNYGVEEGYSGHAIGAPRAHCTSQYSDIVPLSGGTAVFSTLEDQPLKHKFEESDELQEWVTATAIKITLDKMNTFRDEMYGKQSVLQSYFYAISDLTIGGRCKCNGHAAECIERYNEAGELALVCACQHDTEGDDCERCKPFYQDAPWRRASSLGPFPCKPCNCNGRSDECYFDQDLYNKTGHGGHCFNCRGNTAGPHCERCLENYYMRRGDDYCIECRCNPVGSRDLQCNSEGTCMCKPGVGGEKCDQCLPNFYGFSDSGCQPCGCAVAGSLDNEPRCDPASGECLCKENVEGTRCDKCKPGFFNLRLENRFGCSTCFCYGHSSICQSAPSYARGSISSIFSRSEEGWTAEDIYRRPVSVSFNTATRSIRLESQGDETVYFLAPRQFLGDQRASYNQHLRFKLRIGEVGLKASPDDLIVEGGGMSISRPILGTGNTLPSIQTQEFMFTLHEHPDYRWSPRMSAKSFMTILSNITAIKVRGTYNPRGVGFLENVELETARRGLSGAAADWVEICTCPDGYVGQFCESCASGFHHSPALGGPFAKCDPCNCHGHAEVCDAESGKCICADNTAGDNCERCARGFYGNAIVGKEDDCKKCPCPNDGPCVQIIDGSVICTDCAEGYSGTRCDLCSDGFFGDPTGQFGPRTPCRKCDCNGNIDPNAVGNCRRTTGECLKCIYNTAGPRCDECRAGYYGDPLSFPKGDCKPCGCFPLGTMETITHGGDNYQEKSMITYNCDQLTGQCACKPYVIGQKCDRCADGFFNIRSGAGCEACQCNAIGSLNNTCHPETGQCFCKPGVVGVKCDQCADYFYGFSYDGCQPCDCDPLGSNNLQCDTDGSCPCREGVTGRRCDRCAENRYDKKAGCKDCPPCYTLVQMAVDEHREKLKQIQTLLDGISNNRTSIEDSNFENELRRVQAEVEDLLEDTKRSASAVAGGEISLAEQLKELQKRMETMAAMLSVIYDTVRDASVKADSGDRAAYQTEAIIQQAKEILSNAGKFLEQEGGDALKRAKDRSDQFGQQSVTMSELSKKARLLADSHEQEAADIEKMATEAFNTSTEAFNLAERATNQLLETQRKLEQLDKDSTKLTELLRETQEHSTRSQTESRAAREKAMTIVSEARLLSVPDIDTTALDAEAARIQEEAEGIRKDADELVTENESLLTDAHTKISDAEDLLKRGMQQQQVADSLLAEVDAAKSEADSAVERGDAILLEAEKTLKTLKDFDGQVQESKDQAEKAMEMIGEIEKMIQEAEQQTVQARRALLGAEKEADDARSVAEQAENLSKSASQDASKIEIETRSTKEKAGDLKTKSDKLDVEVRRLDERLGVYQDQAAKDKNISRMALEKAEQAKTNAKTASQKVSDGLAKVEEIRRDLNRLDRIDIKELERLENRYKEVEYELQQSGLQETLKEFRIAIHLQRKWMGDYEEEIRFLEEEVSNIKAISVALPDGCFKRVTLEP